jgi:hypothetical protein
LGITSHDDLSQLADELGIPENWRDIDFTTKTNRDRLKNILVDLEDFLTSNGLV